MKNELALMKRSMRIEMTTFFISLSVWRIPFPNTVEINTLTGDLKTTNTLISTEDQLYFVYTKKHTSQRPTTPKTSIQSKTKINQPHSSLETKEQKLQSRNQKSKSSQKLVFKSESLIQQMQMHFIKPKLIGYCRQTSISNQLITEHIFGTMSCWIECEQNTARTPHHQQERTLFAYIISWNF